MAEINLLQNTENPESGKNTRKILNIVGIALLVLVVLAYAGLFFLEKSASSKSAADISEQTTIQQSIISSPDYPDFLAHQSKLSNMDLLLKSHMSWCEVLPDFAKVTLKDATYTKFNAGSDGSTAITGTVPDFTELAKMIQAFQLDNGKFIKDVKLVNVGLGSDQKNDITYTVDVTFNKTVLNTYPDSCN